MNYSHFSPACIRNEPETEDLMQARDAFIEYDNEVYNLIENYPSTMRFLEEKIYGKEIN